MAAMSTFAELMARASATVFSQLCTNALEKAAQQQQQAMQQQQQNGAAFSLLAPLLAIPPSPIPPPQASPKKAAHQQAVKEEKQNMPQENQRRRKRTAPPVSSPDGPGPSPEAVPALLAVPVDRQPSSSPLSGSRISSPDSISTHKARKLKLYAAEEKTDIIDYAKCIGNRAAGREFNVAESSIREWRKNEEKIRRQAETTAGCTQHFEKQRSDILEGIDEALVRMLNAKEKRCSSWYGIAEEANVLWAEAAKKTGLDGAEMKITMGWVSRFMRRKEHRIPKIPPPIIATSNSAIGSGLPSSSPSMVRRSTILDVLAPVETRAKARNKAKALGQQQERERGEKRKAPVENGKEQEGKEQHIESSSSSSSSRRKRFRPVRVDATCATLLTTSTDATEKQQNEGATNGGMEEESC